MESIVRNIMMEILLILEIKDVVNEERCQECNEYYCLNLKDELCYNNYMEKEDDKKYMLVIIQIKKVLPATKCLEGYEVGVNGYCVDASHCEKKGKWNLC